MNSTHAYLNPQLNKSVKDEKRVNFLIEYLVAPDTFWTEFRDGKFHIGQNGDYFWVRHEGKHTMMIKNVRRAIIEELLRLKGLS